MTSKTFKSIDDARKVHVKPLGANVVLSIEWSGEMRLGVILAPTDIPALMLALAEAAGVPMQGDFSGPLDGTDVHLSFIAQNLERYVVESENITAEAEAQAKLEAEALDMCNKYITELGYDPVDSWDGSFPEKKSAWLAVARKAREMRAEK